MVNPEGFPGKDLRTAPVRNSRGPGGEGGRLRPGCPPDADTIYYVFSEILEGRIPSVPTDIMRYD